jgi:4-amino-4-deoxy-L-arabinose transferase-like glycosyltransferase
VGSAIAAGLACATKYFGGIFLIPVFLAGYKILRDADQKRNSYLLWFSVLLIAFFVTFLIVTPGALIDTSQMIIDIRYEMGHYQAGDEGYTVNGGWEHFSLLLTYLFGVFFSKRLWLSLLFSVFVLVGLYALIKDRWKRIETWVFLLVPLLFIPYMSQQRVMMVRNDLLLFPFIAVLCAWGIAAVWNSKFFPSNTAARTIFGVAILSALIVNFSWLYTAGDTISPKLTVDWTQKLDDYLSENKDTTFYPSPGVRSAIDTSGFPNVVLDPLQADKLLFVFSEVNFPLGNRPNVYDPIFGPYEINMDYYPSWMEDDRIMVMPMKDALPQKQFESVFD